MDANQAATNGTHDVLRDKQDQTNKQFAVSVINDDRPRRA